MYTHNVYTATGLRSPHSRLRTAESQQPQAELEPEPHEHWPEPEQPGILEGTPPPAAEPEPQPELAHEKRRQPRREEVAIEKPRTFTRQFAKAVDESPIVGSRSAAYTRGDDVTEVLAGLKVTASDEKAVENLMK